MRKKLFAAIAALCVLCLCLCACNKNENADEPAAPACFTRTLSFAAGPDIGGAVSSLQANAVKDDGYDYDEQNPMSERPVYVQLSNSATTAAYADEEPLPDGYVDVSGDIVHIRRAGTYVLTGTLTDGQINVGTDDRVQLIFRGVNVHCSDRPAVEIFGSGKKILTMAAGTENFLSDDKERTDSTKNGVIRAAHAVTIDGTGALSLTARFGSAIDAGAIKIIGCDLTVTETSSAAFRSGAFILFSGAKATIRATGLTLSAADEVICSSSSLSLTGGIAGRDVFIDGSTVDLASREDGINATRLISAQNSSLSIDAEGDGLRAKGEDPTAIDGIVRLYECATVVTDGDDGIRARYFSFSGGSLFCVGMGTQLCVTEGAVCSWNIDEILLPDGIAAGSELRLSEIKVTLKRKGRIVAFIYAKPYDQMEFCVDDKAVLGFSCVE